MATIIERNSSMIRFKDELTENYDCPFCLERFNDPNTRMHQALGHFIKKSCNKCDSDLIQICDEWYALHPCDQSEPENDFEPPNINFIDVKMEAPLEIEDSFNVPLVYVKEEIETEHVDDEQNLIPDDDNTFETHPDEYSVSNQLKSTQKHEPSTLLKKFKRSKQSSSRLPYHPHRVQRNLKCDICKVIIATYCSLVMHMESKHMPKEKRQRFATCEICDKKLFTPSGVKLHMEKHRLRSEFIKITPTVNEKGEMAHIEDVQCLAPIAFETHAGNGSRSNQPKAKKKREKSAASRTRRRSKKIDDVNATFSCEFCPGKFRSVQLLRSHEITEHGFYIRHPTHPHRVSTNLECDICKKVIVTFDSMIAHMESKHMPEEKRQRFKTCEICNKKLFTPNGVKIHMNKHRIEAGEIEKPSPFMCSFCGKEFSSKYSLDNHEKYHAGITYKCDECGKDFRSKKTLKHHRNCVHSKSNSIECQFENCKTMVDNAGALKRHCARMHGIFNNPHPCPICGKEFPDNRRNLNRHLKAHERNTAKEYTKPTR